MLRRNFLGALGTAAAWPFAVYAQQPVIPRVGYVWIGARGTEVSIAGLRQGLIDKGHVIGRSLVLEERYAEGRAEQHTFSFGSGQSLSERCPIPYVDEYQPRG